MDILKLAKHLKEFTLEEIEMIAECDCETELEKLLKVNKIVLKSGKYTYQEENFTENFCIFIDKKSRKKHINIEEASKYFLENYARKSCSKRTYETYESIFRVHIIPFFKNKDINNVSQKDIIDFYYSCKTRGIKPKRLKNILTQLNQMLKYCKSEGFIKSYCVFQVKRLTKKNEFSADRIVFDMYNCKKAY